MRDDATAVETGRPVLASWMAWHGRNRGLAEELGLDILDVKTSIPDRLWTSPLRWAVLAVRTWRELRRTRPTAALVDQPPVFLLAVTVWFARGRFPIVVDIHHGPFEEPKWKWSLGWTLRLLRRCEVAIVTNAAHQALLAEKGIASVVLHNPPIAWDPVPADEVGGHVFVPLSYSPDEPVDELLESAQALADIRFVLTGRAPAAVKATASDNVEFVGFVPDEDYERLLSTAAAVVCFTDKPNTMQQGGYEALAAGRPFVTSESEVLRAYFRGAATYADPSDADSIREAIADAVARRVELAEAMAALRGEYRETYQVGLEPVRSAMGGDPVTQGGGVS